MLRTTKRRWTAVEKQFLKDQAAKMKDADIAVKLNKSTKAIREQRQRMGIKKKSGRGIVGLKEKD